VSRCCRWRVEDCRCGDNKARVSSPVSTCPATAKLGQALCGIDAVAKEVAALLEHRAVLKADPDGHLHARNRRQVGDAPLHGDRCLAGIVGVSEDRREVIPAATHDATVETVDGTQSCASCNAQWHAAPRRRQASRTDAKSSSTVATTTDSILFLLFMNATLSRLAA
jgi:hypothetical protein